MKMEFSTFPLIDCRAQDIRRQQVAGELNTIESEAQGCSQHMRQQGLTYAGQVFNELKIFDQFTGKHKPHLWMLAQADGADLGNSRIDYGIHQLLFLISWIIRAVADGQPTAASSGIWSRPVT